MAQFSMEIMRLTGSVLRGNQHNAAKSGIYVIRCCVDGMLVSVSVSVSVCGNAGRPKMGVLSKIALDLRGPSKRRSVSLVERMAALGVPGVSVALIGNQALSDIEVFGRIRSGAPHVTPPTLFQAASISKPVAAMAVLRLVDAGRLGLDADVAGYLTCWRLPANASRWRIAVTLRHLLSHTAGITVHGFPGYVLGTDLPTLAQILDGAPPANTPAVAIDIEPGATWRYSGGGYVVVQQIIEDTTQRSFLDVIDDLVLGPLGMSESSFTQPLPPSQLASAAQPHDSAGTRLSEGAHVYPELAAAGLWATAADLGRFAIGIRASLANASGAVLSSELARSMVTPGLGGWGLGLIGRGASAGPAFGQYGSNAGYRSWLWIEEDGTGLAVLTNGDNGQQLLRNCFRLSFARSALSE